MIDQETVLAVLNPDDLTRDEAIAAEVEAPLPEVQMVLQTALLEGKAERVLVDYGYHWRLAADAPKPRRRRASAPPQSTSKPTEKALVRRKKPDLVKAAKAAGVTVAKDATKKDLAAAIVAAEK